MTYRELAELIAGMNDDQKDCDLTVEISDGVESEFYPANIVITDNDVLDPGHPSIIVYSDL